MEKDPVTSMRITAIDEFRGFAIISMILVNFLGFFTATPDWLRHADSEGVRFADLVAPAFLFILAILYRQSLIRRIHNAGQRAAYKRIARRYLVLMALGLVGGAIGKMRLTLDWGILQSIGLSGLLVLPLMPLPTIWRGAIGLMMLVIYQWGFPTTWHTLIMKAEHGGVLGCFAWAGLMLLASLGGDFLRKGDVRGSLARLVGMACGVLLLGLIVAQFVPVNKAAVSPSYVLIATGIVTWIFAAFLGLAEYGKLSIPTLDALGRNALAVFLAHYALVRIGQRLLGPSVPLTVILCGSVCIYGLCYGLAWGLEKYHVYIKA